MGLLEWVVLGGAAVLFKKSISEAEEEREREEREQRELEEKLRKLEEQQRRAERKEKREQKRTLKKQNMTALSIGHGIQSNRTSSVGRYKIPSAMAERKNTVCKFADGINKEEFENIVYAVASRFNRIKKCEIVNAEIYCTVESRTAQSNWYFTASFNNWGHITGKRWIWSENDNSNIPECFGDLVCNEIDQLLKTRNISMPDFSQIIADNSSFNTILDLTFCSRVGFLQRLLAKELQVTLMMGTQEFSGEHLYFVISLLKQYGFTNITSIPIKDIRKDSCNYPFEVKEVIIDGGVCFKGDVFHESSGVVITYHDKAEISMPKSSHMYKNGNYLEVGDELADLGFSEIFERPIRDLTLGWLKKDGAVEMIEIGGKAVFKKNDVFVFDDKVVIEYHTYKTAKQ